MNENEYFRLCSVGFLGLQYSRQEWRYPEGNFVNINFPKENRCTNLKINFITRPERREDVDVLYCGLYGRSQSTAYRITSDPYSLDSAFIVEREGHDGCKLEVHLSNIRVLKPFTMES